MILAIDTAGSRCAVAVGDPDGGLLAARDPDIGRGHAEQLMGLIGEVLEEAGGRYADLGRIAVSVGPGSFTGLRVGVAAARGLSLALGIPAIGVSALEALAEPFRARGPVLAAIDAKRGEVYLGAYAAGDAVLREPTAVSIGALRSFSGEFAAAVFVGSGAPIVANALQRSELTIENAENRIDLAAFVAIGARREPIHPPRPLYLRGADAKPQQVTISATSGGNDAPEALP